MCSSPTVSFSCSLLPAFPISSSPLLLVFSFSYCLIKAPAKHNIGNAFLIYSWHQIWWNTFNTLVFSEELKLSDWHPNLTIYRLFNPLTLRNLLQRAFCFLGTATVLYFKEIQWKIQFRWFRILWVIKKVFYFVKSLRVGRMIWGPVCSHYIPKGQLHNCFHFSCRPEPI